MQEKYRALLKSGKLTYLLIAVCVIAAAAVVFMPEKKAEVTVPETAETEVTAEAYSAAVSAEVAQMVSAITGEADPHVTVTLNSMGETVYATEDRQSERNAREYTGDALNKTQTKGRTASRSRWLSRRHSRRSAASSSSAGGAATRRSAKKLRRP